jgi:hypothetical protein
LELVTLSKTLDPKSQVIDPNLWRLMTERSEWIDKEWAAEQALFMAENGTISG